MLPWVAAPSPRPYHPFQDFIDDHQETPRSTTHVKECHTGRDTPICHLDPVTVLTGQGFQQFCITETSQRCHSACWNWITAISELILGFHGLTPEIYPGSIHREKDPLIRLRVIIVIKLLA